MKIIFCLGCYFFVMSCSSEKDLLADYKVQNARDDSGGIDIVNSEKKYTLSLGSTGDTLLVYSADRKHYVLIEFNETSFDKVTVDVLTEPVAKEQEFLLDFAHVSDDREGKFVEGAILVAIEPVKKGEQSNLKKNFGVEK